MMSPSSSLNRDGPEVPERDQSDLSSDDLENNTEPSSESNDSSDSSDNDNEVAMIMSSTPPTSNAVSINPNTRSGFGAFQPLLPGKVLTSVNNRNNHATLFYQYEVCVHPALQNTKLKTKITHKISESLHTKVLQLGQQTGLISQTHLKDIDGMPLRGNTSIRFLVELQKKSSNREPQRFETIALVRLKEIHELPLLSLGDGLDFADGNADKNGIEMKSENDQQLTYRNPFFIVRPSVLLFVTALVMAVISTGLELFFPK